jgi:hypothetical protein
MDEKMKIEEYQGAVQGVVLCARLIEQYDIPKLLEAIERADAFGGMLDPTLWRGKHGAMMEDKAVLEAGLPLWRLAKKIRESIAEPAKTA